MPLFGGLIAGGLGLFGSLFGSRASKKAADQQQQSAREALAFQTNRYRDTQRLLNPYNAVGSNALFSLADMLGQMQMPQSPQSVRQGNYGFRPQPRMPIMPSQEQLAIGLQQPRAAQPRPSLDAMRFPQEVIEGS